MVLFGDIVNFQSTIHETIQRISDTVYTRIHTHECSLAINSIPVLSPAPDTLFDSCRDGHLGGGG